MIKKLIFCLVACKAAHAMQPAEPVTGAEMVMAQLLDTKNTEADVMRFLESFDDFNTHINVNELLLIHADEEPSGETSLLHEAIKREFTFVIKFLLNHHANPNIRDSIGFTPIGLATIKGYGYYILTLLNYGADQENAYMVQNYDKEPTRQLTALNLACKTDNTCIAKLLLEHGANPNELIDHHTPPLTRLAESHCNKYDCTQALLAAGADPTWQNADGHTALTCAAQYDSRGHFFQALLQTKNKSRTQVLAELKKQEVNLCAAWLALEATPDSFKRRQLRKKCVPKYLLTQTTNDGETPLVIALRYNCTENIVEIVKCLTYHEIVNVIAFAKQFGRYDVLLQALAAPENYKSVLQEALDDNNQELTRDLQEIAMTLYHKAALPSLNCRL